MEPTAILVVEDTPAIAAILLEALNDLPGCAATVVADAALALEALAGIRPGLIVLDVELPGLDGFALHDLLRADPQTAAVPVLFVSAGDHAAEAARRGALFVRKPFDLAVLVAAVEGLLGRAGGAERP